MKRPGFLLRLYRSVTPALVGTVPALAPFSAKLHAGLAGRTGLLERIEAAAPDLQGCVWVHVTSVGEYEQARPIIAGLREELGAGAPPVAVTHFSPSGHEFARKRPAGDFHDYLPYDHPTAMRRIVAAWRPRLLLFVKFDCWPNQVLAADAAGVPLFLLAASLQPRSARLRPVIGRVYRDLFDRFAHIGCCTEEDRVRFTERLGVTCPVTVTGDTRVDQVVRRYEASVDGAVASRLKSLGGRLLVLGSTWPPDEQLWKPVLADLLREHPDLRVVLVPHEPLPERLRDLEGMLDRRGLDHLRLSELMTASDATATAAGKRVVLVDSIGVLAEIYRAGTLAYVGGSFTTGVHNTMEPAVAGLPVMFGPVIQNAEEAGTLVRREAGFVLRRPDEARTCALRLLGDDALLARTGEAARAVCLEQRGATESSLAILRPWL